MNDITAHNDGNGTEDRLAAMEARIARLEARIATLTQAPPGSDTASWSSSGFPVLARGTVVTAKTPEDFVRFLASGWWDLEPWGVWGRDYQHAVRFHIPDYQGGYVEVTLHLQAFLPPNGDPMDVHITANGVFLGRHALRTAVRPFRLRLPPAAIGHGDVILYLQCTDPKLPASFSDSADRRLLGAGLVALGLC